MKVLYISNSLTHYYNQVLNKLNSEPDVKLVVVVPRETSMHVGDGVHQTREGISFMVYELEEYKRCIIYTSFKGLSKILYDEKPDIVIVIEQYLLTFVFNIPVILAMKRLHTKLILKSIPFRLPKFETAIKQVHERFDILQKFPRWSHAVLRKSRIEFLMRLAYVYFVKLTYNLPDAHVDYVEDAYEIFGSYGVNKEKIFIIYNSPDTDKLFNIRDSLVSAPPILPKNDRRLIHVGRLVEWKRVDMLIRAFSRVKNDYPDAELLIIGYGPQEQDLKKLAIQLNVENDVKFVGGVYDPRLLGQYFLASSIYILAGMGGISINDAMCFGLPIICSVGDGTEKILVREEFNGKYFDEGSEDDLAEKIRYLFSRPQLREQMGINSTLIIRHEINIHTVIKGYIAAFKFVTR